MKGLNPLHCGAVVASRVWTTRSRSSLSGLNPLHCGAVVASWTLVAALQRAIRLNPLHCGAVVASRCGAPFRLCRRRSQSPSLRGSGRFGKEEKWICFSSSSQSPSLRGSGRFRGPW